ncbi:cobalt transporter CbiM [Thermomicrobium sp. CFH 73360]|uniref:cobalt transporter CbiM n=1 Tax=Thermomicrobium sp. CFH 73360 TaxID=2951987 RepID=UPI002076DB38|nr:cobalt transporter CbiM [Thermomicrobium sp. CFH 73360]MCM8746498.1 cobalt transporter CbiM [Thermomicrobium sp. CFH 73360]
MHIPDGYISPATALAYYGATLPFWHISTQRLRSQLAGRTVPALALFSAFVFVVMMFNVPVPGGTTAHAVGSVLAAIVLGPWAAVVATSVALIVQALFFGDGGILAIGANCFILAVAMPLVGYGVFRLIAGRSPLESRRRLLAAGLAGYVGINVAALLVGLTLGIQPLLWSENGRALYSPYGLDVAVPALLIPHLTIAGAAEAIVTMAGLALVRRLSPELVGPSLPSAANTSPRPRAIVLLLAAVLVLLTPLGLVASGAAWGEWSAEELEHLVGYVPSGLSRWESWWPAPLPDYTFPWLPADAGFFQQALAYILSAIVGIGLVSTVILALRLVLRPRPPADHPPATP